MNCPVNLGLDTNYDLCIICPHIGLKCNGPNLSVITTSRWCDWCQKFKVHLQKMPEGHIWSNAHIADLAGVSKTTVDRVMSGSITGLSVETMYRISYALIFKREPGADPAKFPCAMVALGLPGDIDLQQIIAESQRLHTYEADLDKRIDAANAECQLKVNHLKDENDFLKKQLNTKDKLLDERADYLRLKDRYIKTLGIALGISALIILVALFADFSNPEIGFIWRETLSALVP